MVQEKRLQLRYLQVYCNLHLETASIAGFDVVKSSLEVKKVIGYLPDEPFLYAKLTGREFLKFIADVRGVQKRDRVEKFIELFELSQSADKLIEGYSLGMKKKIAIAPH